MPYLLASERWFVMDFSGKVMHLFGDDHGGNSTPPGSTATVKLHEYPEERDYYSAHIIDGGLWLGTAHKWHTSMSQEDAIKLAWFVLWRWNARGRWFGLKYRIWRWALYRHVEGFQKRRAAR